MNGLTITNEIGEKIDQTEVPTLDDEVKALLRKLEEPITYFGEDNYDRRQRLIKLLNERPNTNFREGIEVEGQMEVDEEEEEEDDEEFYTPGSEELLQARKDILNKSLINARTRIRNQQQEYEPDFIKVLKHRRIINNKLSKYELYGTQLIPNNKRAISTVKYNKDSSLIACGSWDGNLYILDKDLNKTFQLTPGYHTEKVSGVDWLENNLITGGNEGTINIWELGNTKPINSIKAAHSERITNTLFHPCKDYFISTSFDQTWKLWDYKTSKELMQQEGHLKEILSSSFHPDGSILATGGMDAIGKLWDLRSGKLIENLTSHILPIYSIDWSSNGYQFITGSGDCSIKVWDLRKLDNRFKNKPQGEIFSIPAHKKLISKVKFYDNSDITTQKLIQQVTDEHDSNPSTLSSNGKFLISSSFDGDLKIWSADNWIQIAQLSTNDKVMNCDISLTGNQIVSSSWDKSVKLWSC